jgi:hypothetical protein
MEFTTPAMMKNGMVKMVAVRRMFHAHLSPPNCRYRLLDV